MGLRKTLFSLATLVVALVAIHSVDGGYSASEDELVMSAFRQRFMRPRDHAKVVRNIVHSVNWAPIGSLSRDKKLNGFPFVNVVSIADSAEGERSTGKIFFLLTDLDFTGKDWRHENKVTLLFTSEQIGNCSRIDVDPMEPICARAIINGRIREIKKGDTDYEFGWNAFTSRHPATANWIERHNFYLCLLDIEHIYALDWYGGAKEVSVKDYYKAKLENDDTN